MRTIEACRSCLSPKLTEVLSLGDIALSAFVDPGAPEPKRYPLTLTICESCKLVQLAHTVPAEEMYRNYWYRSSTNRSMTEELRGIADEVRRLVGKDTFVACDIGCNDGTLLAAYDRDLVDRVGFEPAQNLVPVALEHADEIVPDFFSAAKWPRMKGADVVTSIAMFYDLDDPNAFVRDVREVLADDGVWIIQMADLRSMIERNMYDNICHEHLEYYSLYALEHLLSRHGFVVTDIQRNSVNGGSIRVVVRKDHYYLREQSERVVAFRNQERQLELDKPETYAAFARRVEDESRELRTLIEVAVNAGKTVYAYGASTKGNTLLQYTGLDHRHIVAAAERNPDKWGKRTVVSDIPIISEEEARAQKPDFFLALPWHFIDEFVEREAEFLGRGGTFILPLPKMAIIRTATSP